MMCMVNIEKPVRNPSGCLYEKIDLSTGDDSWAKWKKFDEKVEVKVVKRLIPSIHIEYQCPKCRTWMIDHTIDPTKITRFLCSCGQEIIAKYKNQG